MAYTKYYQLETTDGYELLELLDINVLREQRNNPATNIPQDEKIYGTQSGLLVLPFLLPITTT